MKLLYKLLPLMVALVMMGGCSIFQANADLISPPQLPSAKEEIKTAVMNYVPDNAELQKPKNNQESNPIELVDLDGDGDEEAIVFYKTQQQSDLVRGIVLKKHGGWKKIADIDGEGTVLVDLAFADLNHDGKKEILAGFAYNKDSEDYGLLVYDVFSGKKPKVLLDKAYSFFLVDYFVSQESQNLVLIKFNKEQQNTVLLYRNKGDKLVESDRLGLDPYINGYDHVQSGRITKNTWGLMLDVGVGAHAAQTFVILVKDGKMKKLFHDFDDPTFKPSEVVSDDTNQDGILEFGVLEEPYMEEILSYADTPYITVYYQLDDKLEPKVVSKAFYDYEHHYKVDIPLDWPRVEIDQSEDRRYLEIKPAGTDVVYFDVYVTAKKQMSRDGWITLGETEDVVYLSKTAKKDKQNLFQLLEPLEIAN